MDAVITAEHILELRQVCRVFPGTILRQLVFRKEVLQVRFQTGKLAFVIRNERNGTASAAIKTSEFHNYFPSFLVIAL